jgi:hypothetical protein
VTWQGWLAVAAFVVSFGGALVTYFGYYDRLMRANDKTKQDITEQIGDLKSDITAVKTNHDVICREHGKQLDQLLQNDAAQKSQLDTMQAQQAVFWKVLDPHLADIIHSPIHRRRDALMEELFVKKERLSKDELCELKPMLEQAIAEIPITGKDQEKNKLKRFHLAMALGRVEYELVGLGAESHADVPGKINHGACV